MTTNNKNKFKYDGIFLLVVAVAGFLISGHFDLLERFIEYSEEHEDWELDEILSTAIVLVVAMLVVMIRRGRELNSEIALRVKAEREISDLAYLDPLTELPNRRLFMSRLKSAIEQAKVSDSQQAVLFIDIDDFKAVNDDFGHPAGDALLKEMSARLALCVRQTDMISRIAGDEFAILLINVPDPEDAATVAKNILRRVGASFDVAGEHINISLSVGIAIAPRDSDSADELMAYADKAMYLVKRQGKNNYQFFSQDLNAKDVYQLEVVEHLKFAVDKNEMFVEYQPIYDDALNILYVEALLRWESPALGELHPEKFIPLAEKNGLTDRLFMFVIESVCRDLKRWESKGVGIQRVSINVSKIELCEPSFVGTVERILAEQKVSASKIEFEVTEAALLTDIGLTGATLKRLRALGCSLAIDDFGVGHTSLKYLRSLPVQTLKIDKVYVEKTGECRYAREMFNAIAEFGNALGLLVVAEGVETEDQAHFVRNSEVGAIQGFYYSKPLHSDVIVREISRSRDGRSNTPSR